LDAIPFFLLIVVIAFICYALVNSQNIGREWQRFASLRGGRYDSGGIFRRRRVTWNHAGSPVTIDIYATGGKNSTYFTQMHFHWPDRSFRLEVYPEGIMARMGKFFGMQDVQIGSAWFDQRFVITGNREEDLRRLLNADVQTAIERLRSLWGNNSIYVSFNGDRILIKKLRFAKTSAELNQFAELGIRLFDAAAGSFDAGIEFLADQAEDASDDAVCQICGEHLQISEESVSCKRCKTPHHRDCWEYYGACSTYGCGERRYVRALAMKRN